MREAGLNGNLRRLLLALACLIAPLFDAPADADTVRVVAREGDRIRAVWIKRESGEILLPLLACGSLLGAEARWESATNRWEMLGKTAVARGYLDEPLLVISGQPVLVKNPPRLLEGVPYLSLETLRVLGRHGWEVEIEWNETAQELNVRPAQEQQAAVTEHARTPATPPQVPAGAHVIVLDTGHVRRAGARGLKGLTEGEVGTRLAAAISGYLGGSDLTPVTLQGDGEELDPREAASVANALQARLFLSIHCSEYGRKGIAVWCWGLSNLIGTGIIFDPFGTLDGWTRSSQTGSPRAASLGRKIIHNLRSAGIEADGPYMIPLSAIEGLSCPAIAISVEGFGTPEGVQLVADEESLKKLAGVMADTLRAEVSPSKEEP